MGTVRGAESVIDIYFGQTGKRFGKIGAVFLFFSMEAQIFE